MHRRYLWYNLVIVFPLFPLWENVVCLPGHQKVGQKYIQSRYRVRDDTIELTIFRYSDRRSTFCSTSRFVQGINLVLTMLTYFCRAVASSPDIALSRNILTDRTTEGTVMTQVSVTIQRLTAQPERKISYVSTFIFPLPYYYAWKNWESLMTLHEPSSRRITMCEPEKRDYHLTEAYNSRMVLLRATSRKAYVYRADYEARWLALD